MRPVENPASRSFSSLSLLGPLLALVVGCGAPAPIDNRDAALPDGDGRSPDSGAPGADTGSPIGDATIDSVTADATVRSDVLSPPVPPNEPDAGCTCTPGDGGLTDLGVVESLACFCTRPGACVDYATALASCRPFFNDTLDVYETCNLEVIHFAGTFDSGGTLVYDATTHELVGGRYASDTPAFACGSTNVIGRRAGIFPPAECALTRSARLCAPDAG